MTGVSAQLVLSLAVIISVGSLLVALAIFRFPKLRALVAWGLARMIDPDHWNEEGWWDDFRRGLARKLDSQTRHAGVGTHASVGTQLAAYCTSLTPDGKQLVKTATGGDGIRVLAKEAKVIRRLQAAAGTSQYARYLPVLIDQQRSIEGFTVSYQAAAGCYTAEQIRRRHPDGLSGQHVAWMFNRMLEVIGFAHQQGTVHAAVMPQHLLFDCQTHGLLLADWTHAKRTGDPVTYLPRRYRKWYPEMIRMVAEPSLDIYMAAKSARYLAGADPQDQACPAGLPQAIDRFLRSCLIESARMRPDDAWMLHEEFRDLLESVYGAPKFCSLVMS